MFFYQALSIGRMGIVSPIASLGAIVPVAAGLLSGDAPSSIQIIGIIVAIVGIVLASGPELSGGADAKPVVLAIGTAIGFGICLWAIARGCEFSVTTTMVGMRAQTVLLSAIAILLSRSFSKVSAADVSRLAGIGALDILANVTFGYASTAGMLSVVAVIGSIYPVFTVLLAWWLLKERLMPVQYAGVVAALLGVAAISAG
jgi:drug/metabolite transporter (DMT)-like permease